jgi:hypothetical protein
MKPVNRAVSVILITSTVISLAFRQINYDTAFVCVPLIFILEALRNIQDKLNEK